MMVIDLRELVIQKAKKGFSITCCKLSEKNT